MNASTIKQTAALFTFLFIFTFSKAQESSEFVPEWAKSAIWYQIFPERFYNGDPTNDPTLADIRGADPVEKPKAWQIHPWESDWYELQGYELENGEPELWKHLLRRRYGGDLQGIIDKLDYLNGLGVNAIYLNPVFAAPSLHKYDGASYHHIDPNFGPDPMGDRELMLQEDPLDPSTWVWTSADKLALELIRQAHEREMKIIFDGVFNHMGINSFAFQDVIQNQENSPYNDWFIIKEFDNPKTKKKNEFDYEGWFGVKSLPEFREDENGIVSGPRDYIFAATERWMNPDQAGIDNGIDGWRLDVAFCVAHQFWKDWRKHVRSINPEAYMTAEIVDIPEKVVPYMQGDEFDGEMNYNFAFACSEFMFNPDSTSIDAKQFDQRLSEMRNMYPAGVAYVSQNLFGSHDANRIGSHIMNAHIENFRDWGNYFGKSQAANNPNYFVGKPDELAIQKQKMFVVMQMTNVGAPMIYYGDEVGMWGANDPDCRKPMVWAELPYNPERFNPDGTTREPEEVAVNDDLKAFYQNLIEVRKSHPALSIGEFETFTAREKSKLYGFKRFYLEDELIVLINAGEEVAEVLMETSNYWCMNELVSHSEIEVNPIGKTMVKVPAYSGIIIEVCIK